jgi:hypothetical protein
MLPVATKEKVRIYTKEIGEPETKQFQEFAKNHGQPIPLDYDCDKFLMISKQAFEYWRYPYEERAPENYQWLGNQYYTLCPQDYS